MTKLRKLAISILLASALCLGGALALVFAAAPVGVGEGSARDLASLDVEQFDALAGENWDSYASTPEGSTYGKEWVNDAGELLRVEVWERRNAISARWTFWASSPEPNYRKRFPDLTRRTDPPEAGADQMVLFCGNIGHSASSELEDCQIWGYWARYGQYVVYFELYGRRATVDDFREMVLVFDRHIDRVLT